MYLRCGHTISFELFIWSLYGLEKLHLLGWCCPNAFNFSHQLWLNTCCCGETKHANPICISDILNITQSPDIRHSFSAGWNSRAYFSNLWMDNKSKLSLGQWNIHQNSMNWLQTRAQNSGGGEREVLMESWAVSPEALKMKEVPSILSVENQKGKITKPNKHSFLFFCEEINPRYPPGPL